MPELAELQTLMLHGLLNGGKPAPLALFQAGPVPAEAALRVHRNTIFGALVGALAQTYPTVRALVGEPFFDQAAIAYVEACPPRDSCLAGYGDQFAAFIAEWPPAANLAYLGDVARLDFAIAGRAAAPILGRLRSIDRSLSLALPVSLAVLELDSPADLIRAALEQADDLALAAIDLAPQRRWVAVWRSGDGVTVRSLTEPAGRFLFEVLAGRAALTETFEAMTAHGTDGDAVLAIQAEIFAGPFATLTPAPIPEFSS